MLQMRPSGLLAVPCVLLLSCDGLSQLDVTQVAGPGEDSGAMDCSTPRPGPAPLLRLTAAEYLESTKAALGMGVEGISLSPESPLLATSASLAEQYSLAAETLAERASQHLSDLLPCLSSATADRAQCSQSFVETFGERAFRRTLTAEERERYRQLFSGMEQEQGTAAAVRVTLAALLQSPHFLYRVEIGDGADSNPVVPLTGAERAVRLSYLFLQGPPDAPLREAAASGALGTRDGVRVQVRRLLETQAARAQLRAMHSHWLGLDGIDAMEKDPRVFPEFSPALAEKMRTETETFLDALIWTDNREYRSILETPSTFVDATLATFYGLLPPPGAGFQKVGLDGVTRRGLLTQASVLALTSKATQTSPVRRGKWVREHLLCQVLPPPPPNVDITPPDLSPSLTTRERFAEHSRSAACSGCHSLMDPVGLGLEAYDAIGRYRETENGRPIDLSGTLVGVSGNQTFVGALELEDQLAGSEEFGACVIRQYVEWGLRRPQVDADMCVVRELEEVAHTGGLTARALLEAFATSDAFLFRPAIQRENQP